MNIHNPLANNPTLGYTRVISVKTGSMLTRPRVIALYFAAVLAKKFSTEEVIEFAGRQKEFKGLRREDVEAVAENIKLNYGIRTVS